jgi:hypothetical protein
MDIITVLKDTLNTTLSPLPIPDPHITWVPSNTLKRHSIGSHVVDGVHNLVTSTTRNFGFYNYHLQLKFSYMRHMQLEIYVVA